MHRLKVGNIYSNNELYEIFCCANMGGMRRSKATNSLLLITDYTRNDYEDKWIGDVLLYSGMGRRGDQSLTFAQNKTLHQSKKNMINLLLFEVTERAKYKYVGEVYKVGEPFTEYQNDFEGNKRKVWIFKLKLK